MGKTDDWVPVSDSGTHFSFFFIWTVKKNSRGGETRLVYRLLPPHPPPRDRDGDSNWSRRGPEGKDKILFLSTKCKCVFPLSLWCFAVSSLILMVLSNYICSITNKWASIGCTVPFVSLKQLVDLLSCPEMNSRPSPPLVYMQGSPTPPPVKKTRILGLGAKLQFSPLCPWNCQLVAVTRTAGLVHHLCTCRGVQPPKIRILGLGVQLLFSPKESDFGQKNET